MLCVAVIIAVAARLTNAASESESNIIISLQCFQLISRSTFGFFLQLQNIICACKYVIVPRRISMRHTVIVLTMSYCHLFCNKLYSSGD